MSDVYLLDELLDALGRATSKRHVDLLSADLPPAAVDMCGTARIRPDSELYQPDDDGLEAVIVPVFDGGETVDLLAFRLSEPDRWWLRIGAAAFLGGDVLGDVALDEPVRAFKTPLSWLRAGAPADGLVILAPNGDIAVDVLARRELVLFSIMVEDLVHGLELDRLLTIPAERPRISVPVRPA